MRIINGVLAAFLVLFAVVQWNDPDGPLDDLLRHWRCMVRRRGAPWFVRVGPVFGLFGLTCAAALVGLVYYWPTTPEWWMQDVWWETETAREGMGMMILVISLACAALVARRAGRA